MRILFCLILLLLPSLIIKGQTGQDSIIFHGNIVNDMEEEEDIVAQYRYNLFCKSNPQNRIPLDTTVFAIKCLRGDTIVLEVLEAFPFLFKWNVSQTAMPRPIFIFGISPNRIMVGILVIIGQNICP